MSKHTTTSNAIKVSLNFCRSAFLILTFLGIGKLVSHYSGDIIPASVVGLIALFTGLSLRLIPVEWLQPSSHFLLKYMTLFFVPAAVALINYIEILSLHWLAIIVSCVVSTVLVMVSVGLGYQRLDR